MSPALPRVVTNCKGILDTLAEGFHAATGPKRRLARIWNMIGQNLNEDFESVTEMVT